MEVTGMKFEYECGATDLECVAYIDGGGDLVIRGDNPEKSFVFGPSGSFSWAWNEREAVHKFYPGDKLTITF
jgi:hypothetical protein